MRIDTLKFKTKVEAIEEKYFTYQKKIVDDKEQETYFLNKSSQGINNIIVFGDLTAIIQISSKILGKRHLEGITKETLPEVLEKLNKYISFDMEKTQVLKMDVFQNLVIENKREFINQMKTLNHLKKYKIVEYYPNKSIVFEKDQKTAKDRIIFYDKEQELKDKIDNSKDEEKKESLLKLIEVEGIEDIIRAELNINTFAKIKSFLKVESNYLNDVLESKVKPVQQLINKHFLPVSKVELASDVNHVYIKYYCYQLEKHFLDAELLRLEIRKMFSGNQRKIKLHYGYLEKAVEEIKTEYKITGIDILTTLKSAI